MAHVELWGEGALGLGGIARMLEQSFQRLGFAVDVRRVGIDAPQPPAIGRFAGAPPVAVVAACNADRMPLVEPRLRRLPPWVLRAGVWFWETDRLPRRFRGAAAHLDEVWAASAFVAGSVRAAVSTPVHVFPVTLPMPALQASDAADAASVGGSSAPYVLLTFDYTGFPQRKNPWGAIDAWRRSGAPEAGVRMVVKTVNHEAFPDSRARLQRLAAALGVTVIERRLPAQELGGLYAHARAYLSLHRAEGLGLTMAEAMTHGRPVVATGYSGNLDFMTTDDAVLVPYSQVPVGADAGPYARQGHWAEPDVDAAAGALGRVIGDPGFAADLGARARAAAERRFDPARLDAFLRSRVATRL